MSFEAFVPERGLKKTETPFREKSSGVFDDMVREGLSESSESSESSEQPGILDTIIERVADSENSLYSYTRESGFREKIKEAAFTAIKTLLEKSNVIDDQVSDFTRGWDKKIAESGRDPHQEVKEYGVELIQKMSEIAGGKELFVETILALMSREVQEKKNTSTLQ
ncbi:MAG: hypothetical protein HYV45_03235 [Candidatus Moranbacteria bacterium]|nr:hypothetical protein [Candidatus Moranbacteria bacterium]